MSPSSTAPVPRECRDGKRHSWKLNVRKTIGYRGNVETCRVCGLTRHVWPSGNTQYDAPGHPI